MPEQYIQDLSTAHEDGPRLIRRLTLGKEYGIAAVYAARADAIAAVAWLERVDLVLIPVSGKPARDPAFNPIRGDPGFNAFLRKMNLPET